MLRKQVYYKDDMLNIIKAIAIAGECYPQGDYRNGYMTALCAVATTVGLEIDRETHLSHPTPIIEDNS